MVKLEMGVKQFAGSMVRRRHRVSFSQQFLRQLPAGCVRVAKWGGKCFHILGAYTQMLFTEFVAVAGGGAAGVVRTQRWRLAIRTAAKPRVLAVLLHGDRICCGNSML
jgi:hypothetical protein